MARLLQAFKQRPIIIVNGRAIRYQEVLINRPLFDRPYSIWENIPTYREYDPAPWVECSILDTSGRRHEFRVRDESWPKVEEQRRSGRQVIRLTSGDYPRLADNPA